MREPNHPLRIGVLWLICTVIVEFIVLKVLPIPGPIDAQAGLGEHYTMRLLFLIGTPIIVFVYVGLVYSLVVFGRRDTADEAEEAPQTRASPRLLFWWCGMSLVTIIFLWAWGTFTLSEVTDAAGPNPLPVQVIAQQWHFTFRYPTYGGVESYELVVPAGRGVHFDLTSIDVVHDFWIYDMDVKQDAVPGITTHAEMLTNKIGVYPFDCDELCGIWHGYMRGDLTVVTPAQFTAWVKQQTTKVTPLHGSLPPQNDIYYPQPLSYPPPPQNSAE